MTIVVEDNQALGLLSGIKEQVAALSDIEKDIEFKRDVIQVLASAGQQTWGSQGSSIGVDWKGRDLVLSGRLRSAFSNTSTLQLTLVGDKMVIGTSVPYADYVNNKYQFIGFSEATKQGLSGAISRYIQRLRIQSTYRR